MPPKTGWVPPSCCPLGVERGRRAPQREEQTPALSNLGVSPKRIAWSRWRRRLQAPSQSVVQSVPRPMRACPSSLPPLPINLLSAMAPHPGQPGPDDLLLLASWPPAILQGPPRKVPESLGSSCPSNSMSDISAGPLPGSLPHAIPKWGLSPSPTDLI